MSEATNPDQPNNEIQEALAQPGTLKESVHRALTNYFHEIDGEDVTNLYDMVIAEVEAPMLAVVMRKVRSNQSKAAHMLGLNRGTLRKKLKRYKLI